MRTRREFVRSSSVLLSAIVGGSRVALTPAQAHALAVPLTVLTPAEAATLTALADALVPGAAAAGVAHYVDDQLGRPPEASLLMLKYLGVAPDQHVDFYRSAMRSAAEAAADRHGRGWPDLNADERRALLEAMASDAVAGWEGAPAAAVYFAVRADAADVVYGSMAGFEAIGMPYRPHIEPPETW